MTVDELVSKQLLNLKMLLSATRGDLLMATTSGAPIAVGLARRRIAEYISIFRERANQDLAAYSSSVEADGLEHGRMEEVLWVINQVAYRVTQDSHSSVRQAALGQWSVIDVLRGSTGALGQLAQQRFTNPKVAVKDTAGRQWDGEALLRFAVRNFAYQLAIDQVVNQAVTSGKKIVVNHPEGEEGEDGMVIDPTAADFDELRAKVFHPNSRATASVQAE